MEQKLREEYNLTAGELPKDMMVIPLKDVITILSEKRAEINKLEGHNITEEQTYAVVYDQAINDVLKILRSE